MAVRRGWVWLMAGAGALALAAGGAVRFAPDIAGAAATDALRRAGFPEARVFVTSLGLSQSRATVHLHGTGNGATAGAVRIDHPWSGLLEGRVARITVSGARLHVTAAKDGSLRLAGRPLGGEASGGKDDSGTVSPPVDAIAVEDGTLILTTPHGTMSATATLSAERRGEGLQGQGTLRASAKGLPALNRWLGGAAVAGSSGTLSAKLRFDLDGKGLRSRGDLRLTEVAGQFGPVAIAGVNGVVTLASLHPPILPKGQTLAVKLLDIGVPLTDGTVRFGYGRNGRLEVEKAEWRWAGGIVRAEPFAFSPAAPKGTVHLRAERVGLAPLLGLAAVEGLEATGTVSGGLPVRIEPDAVHLDGGVLESDGPGELRYDPIRPPGFLQGEAGSPTGLLMGALTDFRYENLRATLDGRAGGELAVAFAVRGANPSFYDGYPVALNLKVTGALDRILRQSLDAYRIPDAVRDRMTDFGSTDSAKDP